MKNIEEKKEIQQTSSLTNEALKAYDVDKKYILSSNEVDGVVTFVTHGGMKRSYSSKMKKKDIKPLTAIQVTGLNPEKIGNVIDEEEEL